MKKTKIRMSVRMIQIVLTIDFNVKLGDNLNNCVITNIGEIHSNCEINNIPEVSSNGER
jgi:hypothetical protein